MSTPVKPPPENQRVPERRLTIGGKLRSSEPLLCVEIVDKESGRRAEVQVEIAYRLAGLARGDNEGEKHYTLLIRVNDAEPVERPLLIPARDDHNERNYDIDLDPLPGQAAPKPTPKKTTKTSKKMTTTKA